LIVLSFYLLEFVLGLSVPKLLLLDRLSATGVSFAVTVDLEEVEAEELEAEEKELVGTYYFLSSLSSSSSRNTPPRLVVSSLYCCSRIFLSSLELRCTSTASPVNLILLADFFLAYLSKRAV
jgi:hypothetical protein